MASTLPTPPPGGRFAGPDEHAASVTAVATKVNEIRLANRTTFSTPEGGTSV